MKQKFLFIFTGVGLLIISIFIWQNSRSRVFTHFKEKDSISFLFVSPVSGSNKANQTINHSGDMNKTEASGKIAQTDDHQLPQILTGTSPDGDLQTDANGKLIISDAIKKRFDYYLSAVSEIGIEKSIALVEKNIIESLPEEAASEALDILNSYITYKSGIRHLQIKNLPFPKNSEMLSSIKQELENRKKMRRKYMKPTVVESFYKNEEIYDDFSIQCMELHFNTSLTQAEKNSQIHSLESMLDERTQKRHSKYRFINRLANTENNDIIQ